MGARAGGIEEEGAKGKAGARGEGSSGNSGAEVGFSGGPKREADFCSWDGGAGVGISGWVRADIVLWRLAERWTLKSGVTERRCSCCCAIGLVKGLVLLGRAGRGSVGKGPGEARSVSCERLRAGTGGGGGNKDEVKGDGVDRDDEEEEDSSPCRSLKVDDWSEKDDGRVLEEKRDAGICGGDRSEEPLVKDWVSCHLDEDEEERKSDVRVSKGSGFHCASLWIPFSPLA